MFVFFITLLCLFNSAHGKWIISPASSLLKEKIVDIAISTQSKAYALTKKNFQSNEQLHIWDGTHWQPIMSPLIAHIDKMQPTESSLFMLTNAVPQEILFFFSTYPSVIHTFKTSEKIINLLPHGQDIFVIKDATIRLMSELDKNLWHLADLPNISDFAKDTAGNIWAIEKQIVGIGRQATFFIKLRQWNAITKDWRIFNTQQIGPRFFKLATGSSQNLWSLQGEAPTQMYAFRWNLQTNQWNMQDTLKGFVAITVAQDGTVWALHHNNTIYEWREN